MESEFRALKTPERVLPAVRPAFSPGWRPDRWMSGTVVKSCRPISISAPACIASASSKWLIRQTCPASSCVAGARRIRMRKQVLPFHRRKSARASRFPPARRPVTDGNWLRLEVKIQCFGQAERIPFLIQIAMRNLAQRMNAGIGASRLRLLCGLRAECGTGPVRWHPEPKANPFAAANRQTAPLGIRLSARIWACAAGTALRRCGQGGQNLW